MATLQTRLQDLATRIATEVKTVRTLLNGNASDNAALTTAAKANLVAAINEVRQLALDATNSGGATINDTTTTSTEAWSSQRVTDYIAARIDDVMGPDVPATLDTLREIADAIGDKADAIQAINVALAHRVRVDAVQNLTAGEKTQARANIEAYGANELGDPDTDLVTIFENGLAT